MQASIPNSYTARLAGARQSNSYLEKKLLVAGSFTISLIYSLSILYSLCSIQTIGATLNSPYERRALYATQLSIIARSPKLVLRVSTG